jgi:hypothetical protein
MAGIIFDRNPPVRFHQLMSAKDGIIACSVIIAISILIGLDGWGVIKSPIYGAVVTFIIFSTVGSYLLYGAFDALRQGVISINAKASISVYDRRRNPFGFWFYILLFMLIGLMAFGMAFYFLLHPHLH